ncbi:hypothetical protein [Nocardia higoensis]|uniref:hypothetical protein n=1 Tax=Nocardia higoensis TaxID=228599 RepID=UPI0002D5777D|nr:hypothetical protein [Nocardia higoensis]
MGKAAANSRWQPRDTRSRRRYPAGLTAEARRELLLRGTPGTAVVMGVRPVRQRSVWPFAGRAARRTTGGRTGGDDRERVLQVRVRLDGELPYETLVRQPVPREDLASMRAGDTVLCRVDPGDPNRVVLYLVDAGDAAAVSLHRILRDGRRAEATVLAAAPVAADFAGKADPVLRLDLELRAWDEPRPWRVRITQPVPLAALGLVDLGARLQVAFFTVDRGESVAVDWTASLAVG